MKYAPGVDTTIFWNKITYSLVSYTLFRAKEILSTVLKRSSQQEIFNKFSSKMLIGLLCNTLKAFNIVLLKESVFVNTAFFTLVEYL